MTCARGAVRICGASLLLASLSLPSLATPTVIYVDGAYGSDQNAGTVWTAAKATIDAAVVTAGTLGGEIWVTSGTYSGRLLLLSTRDVQIYGGYPPGGGDRDLGAYTTVLDGGVEITASTGTIIDGFTITGGRGTETGGDEAVGGGIAILGSSGVTIRNNDIRDNVVEGWELDVDGDPMCPCCTVDRRNGLGAGIYLSNASAVTIENNLVRDNSASFTLDPGCVGSLGVTDGGGVFISGASAGTVIRGNTIVGNATESPYSEAGGVFIASSLDPSFVFTDNIVWGNSGAAGGARQDYYGGFGGVAADYSIVGQGDLLGPNSSSADPLFVAGALGGYYVSNTAAGEPGNSPAIDMGSDTAIALGVDGLTTRSDQGPDTGIADIGYHFPIPDKITLFGSSAVGMAWYDNGGGPWDVIRAERSNLLDVFTHIDLGPVTCLVDDGVALSVADADEPGLGVVYLYLVRPSGGSYGSSFGKELLPGAGACP